MKIHLILCLFTISIARSPIALFHGMGDQCSNPGFSSLVKYIAEKTGSYTNCIEVGNGAMSSLFMNFQKQAEEACTNLLNDPVLNSSSGIHVVGLSQGSLLARYIAQNCPPVKVKSWVSIGGPNQGVSKVPRCADGMICNAINWGAGLGVYWNFVQQNFGPAGYYRTQKQYDKYMKKCVFLPTFNNEDPNKRDPDAKARFSNIEKAVLWKFLDDTMIIPRDSEWFGQYKDENESETIQFNQTKLYIED